jgi:hypothetical protein
MITPSTTEEELLKNRTLTKATDLSKMTPTCTADAAPILQEAYKKHSSELASIGDRQHKLSLLMLGIFSAGATLIASGHVDLSCGYRCNRSQPAWRSAALAAEKGAHVGQDGAAQVECHLKWLESKYADGETPGKPFGDRQTPQNLGNGLSAELHRAIGHDEMDRLIGIPDIEVRMERQQRIRVVANWLYDEARLARTALCRPLHPMPNAATDGAFVIE